MHEHIIFYRRSDGKNSINYLQPFATQQTINIREIKNLN